MTDLIERLKRKTKVDADGNLHHDVDKIAAANRILELEENLRFECLAHAATLSRVGGPQLEFKRLVEEIEKQAEELDSLYERVCDTCDGDGWCYNAVEGRHPCTCMEEAEPYALLKEKVESLEQEIEAMHQDAAGEDI